MLWDVLVTNSLRDVAVIPEVSSKGAVCLVSILELSGLKQNEETQLLLDRPSVEAFIILTIGLWGTLLSAFIKGIGNYSSPFLLGFDQQGFSAGFTGYYSVCLT